MVRIDLNDGSLLNILKPDRRELIKSKLNRSNYAKLFLVLVGMYDENKFVIISTDIEKVLLWHKSYCSQMLREFESLGFFRGISSNYGSKGKQAIKYLIEHDSHFNDEAYTNALIEVAKKTLGVAQ